MRIFAPRSPSAASRPRTARRSWRLGTLSLQSPACSSSDACSAGVESVVGAHQRVDHDVVVRPPQHVQQPPNPSGSRAGCPRAISAAPGSPARSTGAPPGRCPELVVDRVGGHSRPAIREPRPQVERAAAAPRGRSRSIRHVRPDRARGRAATFAGDRRRSAPADRRDQVQHLRPPPMPCRPATRSTPAANFSGLIAAAARIRAPQVHRHPSGSAGSTVCDIAKKLTAGNCRVNKPPRAGASPAGRGRG